MGLTEILPAITTSWTRNPPKEGISTGNYKLTNTNIGIYDQNAQKTLQTVTIPVFHQLQNLFTDNANFLKV
jgi:hypothetical protein